MTDISIRKRDALLHTHTHIYTIIIIKFERPVPQAVTARLDRYETTEDAAAIPVVCQLDRDQCQECAAHVT